MQQHALRAAPSCLTQCDLFELESVFWLFPQGHMCDSLLHPFCLGHFIHIPYCWQTSYFQMAASNLSLYPLSWAWEPRHHCSAPNVHVKVPQYGDLSLMSTWVDIGSARRQEFWAHPWGLFPSHLTEAGRHTLRVDGTIPWAEVSDWIKEEKGGRELRSGFITLLPDSIPCD